MNKIIRKDGYVFLVEGEKGFETFHNLGKDFDDPRWHEKEEVEIIETPIEEEIKPKKISKKKSED